MSQRTTATQPVPHTAIPVPARPVPAPLLLTVEEAGAALGVGRSFMYELIARGDIKSVQLGRLRRVRPDALTEYIASLTG